MLVREVYSEAPVFTAAQSRMRAIRAELRDESMSQEKRAELVAEYTALDGSWNKERWVEMPDVVTEAEQAEINEREAAELARAEAAKAKGRADAKRHAENPPKSLPEALVAIKELAAAIAALT